MNPILFDRVTSQPHIPLVTIRQEMNFHEKFLKIISSPIHDEQKREELSSLLRERASHLHHVPVNGLKGHVLFFNMKQIGLAPTPLCQAYNKMRVPTISNYYEIGSNMSIILLDPSAIQYIPNEVQQMAGDLKGKEVEFFWTAIDGRRFVSGYILNRPNTKINLSTHTWAYPHALVKDSIEKDVNMGIFPEIGFKNHSHKGAIAFSKLSPMCVHVHPEKHSSTMLYSPDNAHFETIPGSPFGIFWSVTQKDQRVAFSKMLVIFDYDHPICKGLLNSLRNCDTLAEHLKKLESVESEISKTLDLPEHRFMEAFHQLPLAFQYGIYKETWMLFNSPRGIHGDFGKASFENEQSLDKKYHCGYEQRKQAVRNFAARLSDLLIGSQTNLMLNAQSLQKGNNVLKMLRCAELFEAQKEMQAAKLFETFSHKEKEAVFFAIWELSGCPRGNNKFGIETFFNEKTPLPLKSQALLLAASRQTPTFDSLPESPIPEEIPPAPAVVELPILEEPIVSIPAIPVEALSQEQVTAQEVLENLMNLAFDGNFHNLSAEERKPLIMAQFNPLPIVTKHTIYGKVYEYSTDSSKGGNGWGENHVADDLEVLINALQDVLD